MKRVIFIISTWLMLSNTSFGQSKETNGVQRDFGDSLKKWEVNVSINTPEPLTTTGYDYNALTQRIFINGDRKEYTFDAGVGCARKLRGSLWLNLNFNYAYYYAYETRDSRIYDRSSSGYELDTLEIDQRTFEFSSGIFHRLSLNRFQFDFGCQIRFKLLSEVRGFTLYSGYESGTNIYNGTVIYEQSEPGGYAFGFGPIMRVNYKVSRNFSLGVKYSTFFSYYRTGGNIITTQTNIYSWGGTESGTEITSTQAFKGVRFFPSSIAIQLLYSFH